MEKLMKKNSLPINQLNRGDTKVLNLKNV